MGSVLERAPGKDASEYRTDHDGEDQAIEIGHYQEDVSQVEKFWIDISCVCAKGSFFDDYVCVSKNECETDRCKFVISPVFKRWHFGLCRPPTVASVPKVVDWCAPSLLTDFFAVDESDVSTRGGSNLKEIGCPQHLPKHVNQRAGTCLVAGNSCSKANVSITFDARDEALSREPRICVCCSLHVAKIFKWETASVFSVERRSSDEQEFEIDLDCVLRKWVNSLLPKVPLGPFPIASVGDVFSQKA